eukprot:COSAG03_NODE_818_length_5740_cov_266.943272_2_plen_77_part_00
MYCRDAMAVARFFRNAMQHSMPRWCSRSDWARALPRLRQQLCLQYSGWSLITETRLLAFSDMGNRKPTTMDRPLVT